MKQRTGFVSNSSSSSFIISRRNVSDSQIKKIENHIHYYNKHFSHLPDHHMQTDDDAWNINVGEEVVSGSIWMNNFPMDELLERIGVDDEDIEWR